MVGMIWILFLGLFYSVMSLAQPSTPVRWTGLEDSNSEFLHLITVLNQRTGFRLSPSDFLLVEDRPLAHNQFRMYAQMAGGIPLKDQSIRLWTDFKSGETIQFEALVKSDQQLSSLALKLRSQSVLSTFRAGSGFGKDSNFNPRALKLVRASVESHSEDSFFQEVTFREVWDDQEVVRLYRVKGKHGVHKIQLRVAPLKILRSEYEPFSTADLPPGFGNENDEFSIPALVYPIVEEVGGLRQNRVTAQLKHLKKQVGRASGDIFASLRQRRYLEDRQDPVLGLTGEGQALGFWTMSDIKEKAERLRAGLLLTENSFATGGVILQGRYATVSLHPDVVTAFPGIKFAPAPSSVFRPAWSSGFLNNEEVWEMLPAGSLLGRPLVSFEDAYRRPARRLPDHNPAEYINDGFDEVQVYYAINSLFDSLHGLGFTDPELSTRPFHAFLYDPEISMKDNAYYTDDTINFTTYSGSGLNYARDNSTIWHELGHGIMERLMGDSLSLADTGGLSEGMADFVAELVIQSTTKGLPFEGSEDFRIINSIGFNLTNEVHDDGEAYGGGMRDILMAAIKKFGPSAGLNKVGDLTLESMRLCRNHPGLTAELWFSHMLFADQLGQGSVRGQGELSELILTSLAGRNFSLTGIAQAQFELNYNEKAIERGAEGSRSQPIRLALAPEEKAIFSLSVRALDRESGYFHYPMFLKVKLRGGPLQGALHWSGEENGETQYVMRGPDDVIKLNLTVEGVCDEVNRRDGSCVDFAYFQLWPEGAKSPIAKKRFYLRLSSRKKVF